MRLLGRLRLLLPAVGFLAAIGVLLGAGRLSPALGGLVRALLHPLTLVLLGTAMVLLRWGRTRKTGRDRAPAP